MVRITSPLDLETIASLEGILFENSMPHSMLEREVKNGMGLVIGDEVRAYALLRFDGPLVDITRLGVDPQFQGQGLGRQLLEYILAWKRPTILTVKKNNLRALRLYRACGFVVTGHFNEEAAWVLEHRPESESSSPACPSP